MSLVAKIEDIESEIARTQINKQTMAHLCSLRAKLAKYKRELVADPKGGGGGPGEGFDVRATGDARVGFVGFPSVGKSTLLTSLTDVASEAASYEFTTLTCIPGIKYWKGAKIQLLDLPGIIEGAAYGRGRGRQVIACAKTADLILIVLDAGKEREKNHRAILERELSLVGIRLNTKPPDITLVKKKTGGVKINATCELTHLGEDPEKAVRNALQQYKIHNAEVLIRENATPEQVVDVIEGNRKYVRALYCYNKIDTVTMEDVDRLARMPHTVVIGVHMKLNLDYLLKRIWAYMDLVRVYTKRKGEPPDLSEPVVISSTRTGGCTVEHLCRQLHRNLADDFNYGLVWGKSAKHAPQRVGLKHTLLDEDVVQIVKRTTQQQRQNSDYAARCQESYDKYKERKKNKKEGTSKKT